MLNALSIKLVIGLVLAVTVFGGGWYIKRLVGQNAVLEAANNSYAEDIEGYSVAMSVVMSGYQEAEDEKSKLEKTLAEHDLRALAKSKPKLVERRINSGTMRMFAAIETASRAASATEAPADKH